ncbi:NAD(P)/FAD-dependent oxidoreductase [Paenibacillus beijingensis]|uniref:NADH dehydrogenase n=1 Tax=Paenibacillus beijingensis TaxID=1126833 RepID=A0A0D5NR31_9BACL|nr:FAD-dependent oxidoreductase [Paenibacillus beijingensis]AJY77779.1 NADH dehydrogenase [Paenibacillus beijingensis]
MKRFVILGGGYGGLALAQELLDGDVPSDVSLVMIDRMPFQGLKTEYYALAAGTASDHELRVLFPSDPRLLLTYGEVTEIDPANKLVYLAGQDPLSYDWLVIALGCTDNYHGIEGAQQYSSSIQSFSSTRKTYQLINDTKPYGQVSIIGGGLSGVEVAAELRESRPDLNIRIIDRGSSVLSAFPGTLKRYVSSWFVEHHVEMRGNVSLDRVEQGALHDCKSGETILTDVTVWTAGIQPVEIVQRLNLPKDKQGRLVVNDFYQLPEHTNVFVIGDCASVPYSPSGQLAGAMGKQVAEVMQALWKGKEPKMSPIRLKGVLGSLGKKAGFGLMGKTSLVGRVPRLLKSGVLWKSKRHFG